MKSAAALLFAFSCVALACGDSPTEPIELDEFRGIWEIELRANTSCHANAIARTINMAVDTIDLGDGVRRLGGLWGIGTPTVGGSLFTGEFDLETGAVTMLLVHDPTQAAIAFEGTAKHSERIDGRTVPPVGRDAYLLVGSCEQQAIARKVMDFPVP
jgi:hypothetical protein